MTDANPTDPLVAVSEAAREAAVALGIELGWDEETVRAVRAGERDYWPTVRAFARFEASISHHAGMREALERQCANMATVINHVTLPDPWYDKFKSELETDRAALASLQPPQDEMRNYAYGINTSEPGKLWAPPNQSPLRNRRDPSQGGEHG